MSVNRHVRTAHHLPAYTGVEEAEQVGVPSQDPGTPQFAQKCESTVAVENCSSSSRLALVACCSPALPAVSTNLLTNVMRKFLCSPPNNYTFSFSTFGHSALPGPSVTSGPRASCPYLSLLACSMALPLLLQFHNHALQPESALRGGTA